jgi:hypothetical protein
MRQKNQQIQDSTRQTQEREGCLGQTMDGKTKDLETMDDKGWK